MASTDAAAALELWSLAAFRVASFTAAAVLFVHLRGSLVATLLRLDTAIGFAAFLLLWTTTWFATRTGLRRGRDADGVVDRVLCTTVAGGWNGVYVFVGLLIGGLLLFIRDQPIVSALMIALIGSTLGSLLAFTTGAVAGLFYGLADALLFGVSARLFRWVTT